MDDLTCDTCKWHNRECYTSEPYEGKTGKVAGDDWCEFYQPKGNGIRFVEQCMSSTCYPEKNYKINFFAENEGTENV